MAEIGRAALILALLAAVFSAVAWLVSTRRDCRRFATVARNSVIATAALYTLALAGLVFVFVTKDFSFTIVSEHVSRDLPVAYTVSALYADKAGSMLLWGWLISLFTAGLAVRKHGYSTRILPHALSILTITQAFFLALVTLGANLFEENPVPPTDGFGLNPLLQNVAMLVHPPMLYISFAAVSVVFSLVMAALITRTPGNEWIRWVRRWALFAWCTLGLGNLIGMWWSYNELGWGGYWAWDPVENAGLMPWLLVTAFLHSISLQRHRNYLQTWSPVLAIFTFAFTLLIPFITHGGVESPLHGFYGSNFPPYILAAILATLVGSVCFLCFRQRGFDKEQRPSSVVSTEVAFLITNIMLVVLVFAICSGTVLPRLIELLGGVRVAVDRTFFDRAAGPIMLALVFFMGVCPSLGWSRSSWSSMKRNLLYPFLVSLAIAAAVLVLTRANWYAAGVLVCGFPLLTILTEWFRSIKAGYRSKGGNWVRAFASLVRNKPARYGGFVVHIGIILIAAGIIGSSFYGIEKTATLDVGQSMSVGEYDLTYNELVLKQDTAKVSAIAHIPVTRNGRLLKTMYPEYNYWFNQKQSFAEVAVRTTPVDDLLVSLVWTSYDPKDQLATLRAMVNPLIVWIWIGGGFLLVGGLLSFLQPVRQLPGAMG
ncbi:MAG: heme lyase CcmF/NrfE family subunit [Dehalococcoidia bacterium]|nr:heme lyase CcmF/NrfE family subunit [Dehalococcoidia bacterium]